MECFAYFFYIRARNVKKIPVSKYFGFKTYSISGIFHIFSYIRAIRVNNTERSVLKILQFWNISYVKIFQ